MKTYLCHIQLNISDSKKSLPFYKDLLAYFEYEVMDESPEHLGMSNNTTDFWLIETEKEFKKNPFHRKNTGINLLAFRVSSKEDVDRFVNEFIKPRNIPTLYGTPKTFPEYKKDYYAVFFEDLDRIKLEVVYAPGWPK